MDCHLAIIFFSFRFFYLIYYMSFYIVLNLPELVRVRQHSNKINKIKNITVFSGILLQTRTVVQGFLKLRGNYPQRELPKGIIWTYPGNNRASCNCLFMSQGPNLGLPLLRLLCKTAESWGLGEDTVMTLFETEKRSNWVKRFKNLLSRTSVLWSLMETV